MTFEQDYNKLLKYASDVIRDKKLRSDPADLVNEAYVRYINSGAIYNISTIRKYIIGDAFNELAHQMATVENEWEKAPKQTESFCRCCKQTKPISAFYLKNKNSILIPFSDCKECTSIKRKKYRSENITTMTEASAAWKKKNKNRAKLSKKLYWINNRPDHKPKKPKPVKVKPVKAAKVKLVKKKRKKLSAAQLRNRHNERMKIVMRNRRVRLGVKPKKKARPIKELWREAGKRYIEKQKELLTDVYIKSLLLRKYPKPTQQQIKKKRAELQIKRLLQS